MPDRTAIISPFQFQFFLFSFGTSEYVPPASVAARVAYPVVSVILLAAPTGERIVRAATSARDRLAPGALHFFNRIIFMHSMGFKTVSMPKLRRRSKEEFRNRRNSGASAQFTRNLRLLPI